MSDYVSLVYEKFGGKDLGQLEFHQAVKEVLESLVPALESQ